MNRHVIGSWLSGSRVAAGHPATGRAGAAPSGSTGPPTGTRPVAGFGRRLAAVTTDWMLCLAITTGLLDGSGSTTLAVFAVENLLLVGTLGRTVGHRLFGLRVVTLAGGRVTPLAVVTRTVLLCLAVPALVCGADGRGLHDRAARTTVIRGAPGR